MSINQSIICSKFSLSVEELNVVENVEGRGGIGVESRAGGTIDAEGGPIIGGEGWIGWCTGAESGGGGGPIIALEIWDAGGGPGRG